MEKSLPLHVCHVSKLSILINRSHGFLHSVAIAFLIYYRASFFFQEPETRETPWSLWLTVSVCELLLSIAWLLGQAYYWRPLTRTVFPERLPEDDKLPAIDVFVLTADPGKEPTVEVMNTVLSAMALDYPPGKLHVYLSDDAGASVTLNGLREAGRFAKSWLPFCKKYGIKTRCPEAYFLALEDDDEDGSLIRTMEFKADREMIQAEYEAFKVRVMSFGEDSESTTNSTSRDHPAVIEVIGTKFNAEVDVPLLVYVAREKRPSYPHHFKAGALNVLIRVSGLISNSPYMLVLDCDHYCNDPTSARQAMCFHFDPKISSTLSFVLFPQRFHNISKHDIYDSRNRGLFATLWPGMDGLRGPILTGTGFYMKRESLYGSSIKGGRELAELKTTFGSSNEFIKSLQGKFKGSMTNDGSISCPWPQESKTLASCSYERQTKWGEEVGFLYNSVVEDVMTGFVLHCKGWISVYLNPSRPQFLGTAVTSLSDLLIQGTRWSSGFTDIGLSRFSPIICGTQRMPFLQSSCYAQTCFFPLFYCLSLWGFGTIPQLCLLNGIPLYPQVWSPFFFVFLFIFLSDLLKHLYEVLRTGDSVGTLVYEQRLWMMKSVSVHTFGCLDSIMKRLGVRAASFLPTNKAKDDEKTKLYQMGKFDFQTPTVLLVPMVSVIILNLTSFAVGMTRIMVAGTWDKMFVQLLLACYILTMNYAIIEGMMLRQDKGRIASPVILLSTLLSTAFLCLGSGLLYLAYV